VQDDDRAIAEAMAVYPYASLEAQGLLALPREPARDKRAG
jgi:hypothetical protein